MSLSPVYVPVEVGPNFWNIRADFNVLYVVNIYTQMSIIKLPNGKFLLIDTVDLTEGLKAQIDKLTNNGSDIEAIVGVHPFHTMYFQKFYDAYPNAEYYGTPRHVRVQTKIPWKGDLTNCAVQTKWAPDVEFRIPEGAEFVDPKPEKSNHFSCAWVYHRPSKTIHIDDTVMFAEAPGFLMRLFGFKKGTMAFHPSIKGPGLLPHPDSPFVFRDWVNKVIQDWDFENIVTAHVGNKIGGAKALLKETVDAAEPMFRDLHEQKKKKPSQDDWESPIKSSNDQNCECG
ncbi:hypothetical protein AKO1_014030 [Acrasis kona]|uniref:Metallo-beta-lactamase domain-containing protein n=1 Tax=Acrasis kona TaxID=1008807 RepID=A0AAW2Z4Z0_9EUKA